MCACVEENGQPAVMTKTFCGSFKPNMRLRMDVFIRGLSAQLQNHALVTTLEEQERAERVMRGIGAPHTRVSVTLLGL